MSTDESPDACPPASATSREQPAYRIVQDNPPSKADFKTHAELGLALSADECRRASLSIFATYRQAAHRNNLSPRLGAAAMEVEIGVTFP